MIRLARNIDCYGDCHSIVAYGPCEVSPGNHEIGRAQLSAYPRLCWIIGPAGRDDLDVVLDVDPTLTGEQVLARVEMLLIETINLISTERRVA